MNFFFHIGVKKLVNQVRNEIFRQMTITITLTLALDVPVRPMDAKRLTGFFNFFSWFYEKVIQLAKKILKIFLSSINTKVAIKFL